MRFLQTDSGKRTGRRSAGRARRGDRTARVQTPAGSGRNDQAPDLHRNLAGSSPSLGGFDRAIIFQSAPDDPKQYGQIPARIESIIKTAQPADAGLRTE